ncbi:MAG: hypothetical protein WC688_02980 [Parachlamydiales bacterium]|jgi:FtsZ-binding cell division protein ZapB
MKKSNSDIFSKIIDAVVLKSWWLILFLFVCYVGNEYVVQRRNIAINELKNKYDALQEEKQLAYEKKEDLVLRVQSQSDPAWVERVLIKELGVVPENQIKVYFSK